jgi:ankyrin repeat protein
MIIFIKILAEDEDGFTPLHYAACQDHAEVVKAIMIYIKSRRVNIHNLLNKYKQSPFDVAHSFAVKKILGKFITYR